MRNYALSAIGGIVMVALAGCSRQKQVSVPAPPPAPTAMPPPAPVAPPSKPRDRVAPAPKPAPPPVPVPPLEPLTSPEQRSSWSAEIQASLSRAEQNAASLRSRNLPADQQRELGRVESFIRQAREAERARDYTTARTLALRAQVLSEDLMNR